MVTRPGVVRMSPRILVVRLSAIGDVVHGTPVLCALRKAYPNAQIAWLAEENASCLLDGHRDLDLLLTVPKGWLRSVRTVRNMRQRLRAFAPDVTIDIQGLTKSAVAAWLSGAKRRIGFGDEKGREWSRWFNNDLVRTTSDHVIDCNLELLRPLEINSPQAEFHLPERDADGQAAEQAIGRAGLGDRFALINVGAGWPSKLWRMDRYGDVARHLGETHGLRSAVVWAGDKEKAWAEEVVAGSGTHAVLAPRTSLTELAAWSRRAQLFIGSDTGPLHIAAAVGTPCVGMYGPMPAKRNGPYGPQHEALQVMDFEGTSRERRNASRELMDAIDVPLVCKACDRILARQDADGTVDQRVG